MGSPRFSMMANAIIGGRLPPAYFKDLENEGKALKKHPKRVKVTKKTKKGGKDK